VAGVLLGRLLVRRANEHASEEKSR
jgi:hypothetical protein